MATQTPEPPSPAAGPEIRLSGRGGRLNVPDSVIAAVEAEAGKSATAAPEPAAATPVPPEPQKQTATPPAANGTPAKAPETRAPVAATPPAPPKSDKEENLANLRKKLEAREAEFTTLQNSLTATTKEKADALQKIADTEARVNKLAEEIEKDYKPRAERLKVVEQELQKREEVLKVKAYQETSEFHDRFVKPLADAQGEVNELLSELVVNNGDGTSRQATIDDFNEILGARSLNDAHTIAANKFGPIAPTLVNFRTRIRGLERTRAEATKRSGEMAMEYEQRRQSEMLQQQQQFKGSVYAEAERLLKETLQIDDSDPEEKTALAEAQSFADGLWSSDNETVEQVVKKAAKARKNNIEAPVLRKRNERLQKKVAELEAQLKEYQRSEPQLEPRGGGAQPSVSANGDRPERAQLLAAVNEVIAKG